MYKSQQKCKIKYHIKKLFCKNVRTFYPLQNSLSAFFMLFLFLLQLDKRQVVSIHPSSDLHGQLPFCVLFTEVVQTNKCYLRSLTTIECEWLQEVAPEYMRSHRIIR